MPYDEFQAAMAIAKLQEENRELREQLRQALERGDRCAGELEQLNAFTVTMANELIDAYQRASDDDAVGAVVVTGAGKAFCAGMDLSVEGNVFGLDESLDPSLAEQAARWDDPAIVNGVRDTGGRVSLGVYDCKKPVMGGVRGLSAVP